MINPGAGDLLIAPPGITDGRFNQAVILMVHNSSESTWGLCLNKPSEMSTQRLLEDTPMRTDLDLEIFWGGPVNPGIIWILHDDSWSMDNTLELNQGWFMTSNPRMFQDLEIRGMPDHWRLFGGFSAWAPGQLESEIEGHHPWSKRHSWLVAESPGPNEMLDIDPAELWRFSLQLCGQQTITQWMA